MKNLDDIAKEGSMMELNGSKYLTNEELAVINAMRMGGEAQVHFFNSTTEAAYEHALSLITLAEYDVMELTTEIGTTFVSHDIHIGKHRIYHFVDK